MQSSFNTDRVLASPGAVTAPFARALFDQSIALFWVASLKLRG